MPRTLTLTVEPGDIAEFEAEAVALKYAQEFFGADRVVAQRLTRQGVWLDGLRPRPNEHFVVETQGAIRAPRLILVGTPPLAHFTYTTVRQFTANALAVALQQLPSLRHLAMTIHGVHMGLDEIEVFLVQVRQCLEAARTGGLPAPLERISIVEKNFKRAELLRLALDRELASLAGMQPTPDGLGYRFTWDTPSGNTASPPAESASITPVAPVTSDAKPYVFVAMPFSDEMTDVYNYGIQKPVHAAGYLCGRVDYQSFVGDIVAQIKSQIDKAEFVIADLTGANPNVYLEVGYAWGRGITTILTLREAKEVERELKFDVRGQRCLIYKNITHLEEQLARELRALKTLSVIGPASASRR